MQSLDRIHRRGQARDVEYIVLLCDGSVEEQEYERILRKVDQQADLLGDPEPHRPTREMMLAELLEARTTSGIDVSVPTKAHKQRVGELDTLAILAGDTAPVNMPWRLRPDVLRGNPRPAARSSAMPTRPCARPARIR